MQDVSFSPPVFYAIVTLGEPLFIPVQELRHEKKDANNPTIASTFWKRQPEGTFFQATFCETWSPQPAKITGCTQERRTDRKRVGADS